MTLRFRQPRLRMPGPLGPEFFGRAETETGDVWWYTDPDGKRRPLQPVEPLTLTDDLRAEGDQLRRRFVHHTRPKGPLTIEQAQKLCERMSDGEQDRGSNGSEG
jgi:hypothetical protein